MTEGSDPGRGLLEIYYQGEWGTVCDDGFDDVEAGIACRQLGFSGGTAIYLKDTSPDPNKPIWLDDVDCDENDTRLIDCDHADIGGVTNCLRFENVSVDCDLFANLSSLSLSGVQIGTFSPDTKNYRASVGYSVTQTTVSAVAAETTATVDISPSSSVNLRVGANVITITVTAKDDTTNTYTVTVNRAQPPTQNGNLRILNGLLEVYNEGVWGTVCDDNFNINSDNARVACRQLGFSGGTTIFNQNTNPNPNKPIWLDDVDCGGTESRLIACNHAGIGVHNCLRLEDVGVRCDNENDNANLSGLRLSDVEIGSFSAAVTAYTTAAAHSVTQTTVSAVAANSDAMVDINPSSPVSLSVGGNTIIITVTAADTTTRKTYTVTVNREGS